MLCCKASVACDVCFNVTYMEYNSFDSLLPHGLQYNYTAGLQKIQNFLHIVLKTTACYCLHLTTMQMHINAIHINLQQPHSCTLKNGLVQNCSNAEHIAYSPTHYLRKGMSPSTNHFCLNFASHLPRMHATANVCLLAKCDLWRNATTLQKHAG